MTGDRMKLVAFLMAQKDGDLFDLTAHKEKRTKTQNAYYWQLVGKVADKLRESKSRVHNEMLRSYGQLMYIDGQLVTTYIPDTDEAERTALEAVEFHIKPTSQVRMGVKGQLLRTYVLLKGSSDYTTEEMSVLVDGIISEAKQLDIETMTPDELERMRQYEVNHKR